MMFSSNTPRRLARVVCPLRAGRPQKSLYPAQMQATPRLVSNNTANRSTRLLLVQGSGNYSARVKLLKRLEFRYCARVRLVAVIHHRGMNSATDCDESGRMGTGCSLWSRNQSFARCCCFCAQAPGRNWTKIHRGRAPKCPRFASPQGIITESRKLTRTVSFQRVRRRFALRDRRRSNATPRLATLGARPTLNSFGWKKVCQRSCSRQIGAASVALRFILLCCDLEARRL